MSEEAAAKRVSWVELYFDLIFVFAVGQLSHIMVTDPHWAGLGIALGLFLPLWWTWVGFAVLYNRHGQDKTAQRLLVLAGTLPCAVAVIWALALLQEAGFLLLRNEEWAEKRHGERTGQHPPARRSRLESMRAMLKPPADPARGVDAGHLGPAFSLLTMAAGVSLVLSGEAPTAAAWFITGGLASYLPGTRVVVVDRSLRFDSLLRMAAGATSSRSPANASAYRPRAASTCLAMACWPRPFGWNGKAGDAGIRPSIHLVPGRWHTSCPMVAR